MLSLASRLCFVACIGLLAWAIVQMALPGKVTPTQTELFIGEPEQDLGEQPVGIHDVAFRVRNPTLQPQRVVGLSER